MSNPNPITTTATAIADQLGETAPSARATIWRTVRTLGPERAQAFVPQGPSPTHAGRIRRRR